MLDLGMPEWQVKALIELEDYTEWSARRGGRSSWRSFGGAAERWNRFFGKCRGISRAGGSRVRKTYLEGAEELQPRVRASVP